MALRVWPVTESFAAEIEGVDLRALSGDDEAAIKQAFRDYAVLVFPGQALSQDEHLDFARRFGPLETSIGAYRKDHVMRLRPEFADVSNLVHGGGIWGEKSRLRLFQKANELWHTDSSFRRVPARCSLLYARSIAPAGGRTEFADLRAAYDALPEATKRRLEGLVAEHSIFNSRARLGYSDFSTEERENMPPVPQLMVRTHVDSGRKTLYIASHAGRVFGLPDEEGRALIDDLLAHATQRQFVYSHRWRVGDLVMWDDRCTLHRVTRYDDLAHRRDMQRATVSDELNTCEREGVAVAGVQAA